MNRRLRVILLLALAMLVPLRAWAVDRMLLAPAAAHGPQVSLSQGDARAHEECPGHAAQHEASPDGSGGPVHPVHCPLCVLVGLPASEFLKGVPALPRGQPDQDRSSWRSVARAPLFKPPIS